MGSPMKKLLMNNTKPNLDIFWLNDESLEDLENLPDPDTLARNMADGLEDASEQSENIYKDLEYRIIIKKIAYPKKFIPVPLDPLFVFQLYNFFRFYKIT